MLIFKEGLNLDKIRVKNLRTLLDTGKVDIKPLTLLVGKNSSGKSTFLRFFPLMKQTLETRTNEPILWYSSRYVDFGSFQESLNFKNKGETIGFEFEFKIPKLYMKYAVGRYYSEPTFYRTRAKEFNEEKFSFNVDIECAEEFIKSINIGFEDHTIHLKFKSRGEIAKLIINNIDYSDTSYLALYLRESTNILPNIFYRKSEENEEFNSILYLNDYFSNRLMKNFKKLASGNTGNETIRELINELVLGSSEDIYSSFSKLKPKAKTLAGKLKKISKEDALFEEIKNNILGKYVNELLEMCNKYFEINFSNTNYIAPLRASAERYYRIQGLSVDEIDPQGTNIPMMIHNMNERDKESFISWTKKNFNFEIITTLEGGHTSLKLKYDSDSEEINLADTGFGYSQLLPIILVMWQVVNVKDSYQGIKRMTLKMLLKKFEDSMHTIVIEQPELHLHPALQAKLMDTFIQIITMAQEMRINIKIILETHSETILNRIGYLIAKKKYNLHHDLINVLIFNKVDTYQTKLTSTGYDERGRLLSWPIGFFSPEDL